jgi:HSP20 family molecular chaperone IbpA
MTGNPQQGLAEPVKVIESKIIDRMNETNELIAQRAYEIFQGRNGGHGPRDDNWFQVEKKHFRPLAVEHEETDEAFQLTAQVPGFDAQDLEIILGHRRAVICGVHSDSKSTPAGRDATKVMRIIDIPFEIESGLAEASRKSGTLRASLSRSRQ